MLIKVKTLTGKEIEIDIEPDDRVSASRSVWRRRRASLQLSSGSFLAGNK